MLTYACYINDSFINACYIRGNGAVKQCGTLTSFLFFIIVFLMSCFFCNRSEAKPCAYGTDGLKYQRVAGNDDEFTVRSA